MKPGADCSLKRLKIDKLLARLIKKIRDKTHLKPQVKEGTLLMI